MRWVCYGYFVDLQLPIAVRSSYLSKLCGSMSVLAVESYLMYLIILAMQDMRRMVTWAGHRLLSARSRARTATVARMKRVKLHFLSHSLYCIYGITNAYA